VLALVVEVRVRAQPGDEPLSYVAHQTERRRERALGMREAQQQHGVPLSARHRAEQSSSRRGVEPIVVACFVIRLRADDQMTRRGHVRRERSVRVRFHDRRFYPMLQAQWGHFMSTGRN
jgi:hypothetical protein